MSRDYIPHDQLCDELRRHADAAEAGGKLHWATAMRLAAELLQEPIKTAMRKTGSTADDLHICGQCDGTGYT